jgi:hypothetical protein
VDVEVSRLPNFFIVGAPKAGTTSLYNYLDQHPQVYMSPIKEPNFFSTEIRIERFAPDLQRDMARDALGLREYLSGPMRQKRFGGIVTDGDDYLRLFAGAKGEQALGEASVCYLWSPTAPVLIGERIPGAKIIVILRNPVDRAFSQYLHGRSNGAITWSFRQHIERNLRDRSERMCVHYPFLELGLYHEQVTRYLERFGRSVWVGFYEDFKSRPREVLEDICRFLGVSPDFSPDTARKHMESQVPRLAGIGSLRRSGFWGAAARLTPSFLRPVIRRALMRTPGAVTMDAVDRQYLADYYRDDIRRLSGLLGRNLDSWSGND